MLFNGFRSNDKEPLLFILDRPAAPIVQVKIERSISGCKFQFREKLFIVHQLETIKDIVAGLTVKPDKCDCRQ